MNIVIIPDPPAIESVYDDVSQATILESREDFTFRSVIKDTGKG